MKSLVVLVCVLGVAYGQFARAGAFSGFGRSPYRPPYQPFVQPTQPPAFVPSQPVARYYNGDARNAQTLRSGNDISPDGSYAYFYETDNGIAAQEQGTPRNFGGNPPVIPDVAQGSFSWTSPEGKLVSITYVADENGYQPQGDAIPTPPPVPPQIARALDYIARSRGVRN